MSPFPPEIWKSIAEELTDRELRKLCGVHPALFEVAMKRLYCRFQLPFVPRGGAVANCRPYLRSGLTKWISHLKNPLFVGDIQEVGLNLHSLDLLLRPDPGSQNELLDILSNLGKLRTLCICCHIDLGNPPGPGPLNLATTFLTNIAPNLTRLSLRLPAIALSDLVGSEASSIPDLRLEMLRISITGGYVTGQQSCPPSRVIALVSKTIQSIKSLEFYCWDLDFDMSGFLSELANLRFLHLRKFGIGVLMYESPLPDATYLNEFLLAHNSTLTDLSLPHGLLVRIPYPTFYEWYRCSFQGIPLNHTLRSLELSALYNITFMDPSFLSILGSVYTSLTSLTFLTDPLSLYSVEMLLKEFTCDQLKSIKLNIYRLDTKLVDLLKKRCPKLEEIVLGFRYNFDDIREHESRRILFQDALAEWKGSGEHDDWILSRSLDVQHVEAFKCARRHLGYDMGQLTASDLDLFGDKCESCMHEDSDCLTTMY